MATYKQIQDDIRSIHIVVVKSCWIAHVKELNGLQLRQAPNRISPVSASTCAQKIIDLGLSS